MLACRGLAQHGASLIFSLIHHGALGSIAGYGRLLSCQNDPRDRPQTVIRALQVSGSIPLTGSTPKRGRAQGPDARQPRDHRAAKLNRGDSRVSTVMDARTGHAASSSTAMASISSGISLAA